MSDDRIIQQAIAEKFGSVKTTLCLSDKVVVITEDRLELLLGDGIEKLSHRNAWLAPAGILASCIAALTTANFREFAQIKASAWQAIFIIAAIGSAVWLVQTLIKRRKTFGRTEFLNSIKVAGTRLNYGEPVEISSQQSQEDDLRARPNTNVTWSGTSAVGLPVSKSLLGQRVRIRENEQNRKFITKLQCRQCGNFIVKPRSGTIVTCSRCGALN